MAYQMCALAPLPEGGGITFPGAHPERKTGYKPYLTRLSAGVPTVIWCAHRRGASWAHIRQKR